MIMKKIVFLLWSLSVLCLALPAKASGGEVSVTVEDPFLVIEGNGSDPFKIERGDSANRYTITQHYYEKGHYILFGYVDLEETMSKYDGYVLIVSDAGVIVHEHIIDRNYLEEVKNVSMVEEALYLLVDQSVAKRPEPTEFKSSVIVKITDKIEYLYESQAPLKRFEVDGEAVFMSTTYSGPYERALMRDGSMLEKGETYGLSDGKQYTGQADFYTLCGEGKVDGEAVDKRYTTTYPGHYVFTCDEDTTHFTVHPEIEGIKLFENKPAPVSIDVSEGRLWLNDDLYVSKSLIDRPGYHTLKIEGANGYELRRSFTLTSNITGAEEGKTYQAARTLYFSGDGFLNGTSINSGEVVDKSGVYELQIKGFGEYTETLNFTLDVNNNEESFDKVKLQIGVVLGAVVFTAGGVVVYKKRK
jgi:hypothetical protein